MPCSAIEDAEALSQAAHDAKCPVSSRLHGKVNAGADALPAWCASSALVACKVTNGSCCMQSLPVQEGLNYRQGPTKHFFESAEAGREHSLARHGS